MRVSSKNYFKPTRMKISRKKQLDEDLLVRLRKQGVAYRVIAQEERAHGFPCCTRTVQERWKVLACERGEQLLPVKRDRRKLNDRTRRWLARCVTKPNPPSGRELLEDLQQMGKGVGRKAVWEALASNPYLKAKRPRKVLFLTQDNMRQRKQWACQHLRLGTDWKKVMFSDEKLFFLDGPTERPQVWMDKRRDPVRIATKGTRNAAVCVWGAFSVRVVPDLYIVCTHFDSNAFCEALEYALLDCMPRGYTLCFDRHPAHKSVRTQEWLRAHGVKSMLLPPKGADMNPIETLWARMTRLVYGQTKTYTSMDALIEAIKEAWEELHANKGERAALVDKQPERLHTVVARKGAFVIN